LAILSDAADEIAARGAPRHSATMHMRVGAVDALGPGNTSIVSASVSPKV
jgi:hypothetical protein